MSPDQEYDRRHVQTAVRLWLKVVKKETRPITLADLALFADFIGYPFVGGSAHRIVPTDKPEVRRILDMVNGPNGNTILKIIEARGMEGLGDKGR